MKTLDYIHLDVKKTGKIVDSLQQLLSDFQIYYTNMRGFHWHIQGKSFFVLHAKFEEMYTDSALKVDEIAERILMLGGIPLNKFSDYLKKAKIKEVSNVTCGKEAIQNILDTHSILITQERSILSHAADANDESTVAMISEYLKEQEKMVWMLTAFNTQGSCESGMKK